METAESFLRVAGVVITLLMAVLLVRDSGRTLVGRLAATFSLGVATYMVCSSPGFHELPPYVHIPALALCVSNPIFFWLLARALFDDGVPDRARARSYCRGLPVAQGHALAGRRGPVHRERSAAPRCRFRACRARALGRVSGPRRRPERGAPRLPDALRRRRGGLQPDPRCSRNHSGRCRRSRAHPRHPHCRDCPAGTGVCVAPHRPAGRRAAGAENPVQARHAARKTKRASTQASLRGSKR